MDIFTIMYFDRHENNIRQLTNIESQFFQLIRNLIDVANFINLDIIFNFLLRRRSPRTFDINARDSRGKTALSLCISEIYGFRLRNEFPYSRSETDLIKHAVISLLINNGASVHIQIPHELGYLNNMIHIACERFCQLDIVQLLIDNGSDVNSLNEIKQTPLHFAAGNNNAEIMSLLIEYGANVNCRDNDNETPMTFLMRAFAYELLSIDSNNLLLKIDNCLDLLLNNGGNLNDIGKNGASCLFMAINGLGVENLRRLQFLIKLIEEGADINVGYTNKVTRYLIYDHEELIEPEIYIDGDTPLHAASNIGDLNIVKLLLSYNPDINRGNSRRQTAVDYAIIKRHYDIRDEIAFHFRKTCFEYNKKPPTNLVDHAIV